jgi:hypothetical protein
LKAFSLPTILNALEKNAMKDNNSPMASDFMCHQSEGQNKMRAPINKAIAVLLIGFAVLAGGCKPSVREVVEVIKPLPLGISKQEVRKALIDAYGKKFPKFPQSYDLSDAPNRVTEESLRVEKHLIQDFKREGRYINVYPANLLETLPTPAVYQMIGLASEGAHGNGYITLYFDKNLKYIGFVAASRGKAE